MARTERSGKGTPSSGGKDGEATGTEDWRARTLSRLRDSIQRADPAAVEEMKWKKPSNPAGVPVWSHDGMICVADTLKQAVRLTFPKGAHVRDPKKLFNTRLESRTVRAIDFHEGQSVDEAALAALVLEAVRLNASRARERERRAAGH